MKKFVYISHPSQIREIKRDDTREKARKYILERFGFDYDDVSLEIDGFGMWRQFLGVHFENAVVEILCRLLNFDRFDLTYLLDGFSTKNPFKMSLIKMKMVKPKNNERWAIETYNLSDRYAENQVIKDLEVLNGLKKAYEFHREMMKNLRYESKSSDISDLLIDFIKFGLSHLRSDEIGKVFRKVFLLEKRGDITIRERFVFDTDKKVFISKSGKKTVDINEMASFAENGMVLPSSETYYRDFFFFLPGILEPEFIQIEAEFETADQSIVEPALDGFWKVKEVTGQFPSILVIKDINAREEFHFTKNPGCTCFCLTIDDALESMRNKIQTDKIDFYELSGEIGRNIIELVGFKVRN